MLVKLGQKAKDQITGFEGRITGRCQYLTGCNQALLVPPVKPDGELIGGQWFDEDRLIITEMNELKLQITADGPDSPPNRSY